MKLFAQARSAAAALILSCLAMAIDSHAAVLQVNADGMLTGATGVVADGKTYNVTFNYGTCLSLFNGCSSFGSDFLNQYADAYYKSQALLDQVFIDGPQGSFDSNPFLTAGCGFISGSLDFCIFIVPYYSFGNTTLFVGALNGGPPYPDQLLESDIPKSFDTSSTPNFQYAIFVEANNVPEPTSIMLAGIAGVALFSVRRRRPKV